MLNRLFNDVKLINYTVKKTDNTDPNWTLVDLLSRRDAKITVKRSNAKPLLEPDSLSGASNAVNELSNLICNKMSLNNSNVDPNKKKRSRHFIPKTSDCY